MERPPVVDAGNARRTEIADRAASAEDRAAGDGTRQRTATPPEDRPADRAAEDAYAVMAGAPVRTRSAASHPTVSTERAAAEPDTAAVMPAASQATAGRSRWSQLASASPDDASLLQVHVRGELQRLGHTVAGPLSAAVAQHYDELDPVWDTHSVQRRAAAVAHRIATGDDLPLSRWHELTRNVPDRASALRVLATVELQRAQYPTMPLTAEDFAHAYDRLADTWHAQPLGDQATALAHRIRTGTDLPPHALTPTTPGRAGAVLDHDHAQRLDLTVRAELAAAGHPAQDLTPGRALVLHHFLDPAWHTTTPGHQAEAVARWIRTETRPGPPTQTRTTPARPATMSTPALLATGTSTETSAEASVAGSRGAAPAREDDRFLIEEVRREFRTLHPDGIVPPPTDADIRVAAGILPERPGRVTLRQRGEEIAQFLLTGDKVRFLGGANSAETELLRQLIVTNGPELLAGTKLAQHPSGATVVMEVSAVREHAGRLYLPGSEGAAQGSTVQQFIPEIVLPPLGVLPGEHSRVAAEDGMRLLQEVQQALRNAAPSVSGRPVSLASVLPPRWTVTDAGRRIYMGNTVRGAEQRTYTQFTIGVPVAALAGVHETALEHLTYRMLAPLMHSARRFADRLAAVYAAARIGRPVTPGQVPFLASSVAGLEELRGYGWLLYAHGAAVPAAKRLYAGTLTKNLLVAASRNSFALIRSSLHPDLRAFLAHADRQAEVVDLFLTEFDDFLARRRNTARRGADGTRHILEDGLTGAAERTVGEYLDTMLADIPAEDQVSQYEGVGMRDYPLDTHDGAFPEGLVLLEMRQFGGDENQQTDEEVSTAFTGLVRVARQAYEEAGRLRSQAATHPAVPGVVLDHPLVPVLTAVFERTAEVHVPVPGRRTPVQLLPGTEVRQLASMVASFALGGPLPPGVEQAMGALAQRTRQALAGTTAPEQARRLEDVLAVAEYAQAHLQAVTALNNGLGRPATAAEITTAAALGTALGRPARPDETVAVTAVMQSLPQDVRGNVSEYQTLTAYQAYFQSHGGDPSSPQTHQAAVRYAGAVLTGSRRTRSSSLAAMLGGSRDAGTDPLAEQWPLGRSFTSAGPRTDGSPPARVPADRVPAMADAARRPGEWHVITQPHPHSSTGFSYRVHSDGRISLPDGTELPPGPWVPYGHDFVLDHPDAALHLLRGDSGWIGRPDNAETLRSTLETEVWYHLTPGPDGLVLVPDEEAATDQAMLITVPLTAEAPAAEAAGTAGSAAEVPTTEADARGTAPVPEDDQHLHLEVRREYARLRPGAGRPSAEAIRTAAGALVEEHRRTTTRQRAEAIARSMIAPGRGGLSGGMKGDELETGFAAYRVRNGEFVPEALKYGEILAARDTLALVVDHRTDPQGTKRSIVEIATAPYRILKGERTDFHADMVAEHIDDVFRRLEGGGPLGAMFPESDGFEVNPEYADLHFRAFTKGVYAQFNVGVSYAALPDFLRSVKEYSLRQPKREMGTDNLVAGELFADRVTEWFAGPRVRPVGDAGLPQGTPPHVRALHGYLDLVYLHTAGAVLDRIRQLNLNKNEVPVLARTPFHEVRAALPQDVKDFLEAAASRISDLFDDVLKATNPWVVPHVGAGGSVLDLPPQQGKPPFRLYLDNALREGPERIVTHEDLFGGLTELGLDYDGPDPTVARLVLELRRIGTGIDGREDVTRKGRLVEDWVRGAEADAARAAAPHPAPAARRPGDESMDALVQSFQRQLSVTAPRRRRLPPVPQAGPLRTAAVPSGGVGHDAESVRRAVNDILNQGTWPYGPINLPTAEHYLHQHASLWRNQPEDVVATRIATMIRDRGRFGDPNLRSAPAGPVGIGQEGTGTSARQSVDAPAGGPAGPGSVGVDAEFEAAVREEPLLAEFDSGVVRRALEIRQGAGRARMGIGVDAAEASTRWWHGVREIAQELGTRGEARARDVAVRLAAEESAAEQGGAGVRGVGRVGLAGGAPARRQQSTGQVRQGSQSDQAAVPQNLKARVDAGLRGAAVTPSRAGQVLRVVEAAARVEGSWHEEWPVEQVATVVAARSWTVQEHGATIQALTRPGRLHVAEAAAAKPLLAHLMHRHPTLLEVLTDAHQMLQLMSAQSDWTLTSYHNMPAAVEGLLIEQDGRRPLVEAIEGGHRSVQFLLGSPGMTVALDNRVALIKAVAGASPAAWAVMTNPRLAKALVETHKQHGDAYTRTFGTEWALSAALYEPRDIDYTGLLSNLDFRRRLQQHADQAVLLVNAPRLLAAAMDNPDVTDVLARGWGTFKDVLEDVPAFADRLAGRMEWLRAAAENHAVAQVLSLEPGHFDTVGDEELEQALRRAEAPALPGPGQAVVSGQAPAGSPLERARAANPGLAALLAREPHLTGVLESDPELADTLARYPNLLFWPHHFRRLLTDRGTDLRPRVREGSPLLAPLMLAGALRHRDLREWFAGPVEGITPEQLVTLPAGDPRRKAARDAAADHEVAQMLYLTPTHGQVLRLFTPTFVARSVRIFRERPSDERALQNVRRPGYSLAVAGAADLSVFLEVVLRDEAALLRLAGDQAEMLQHLGDKAIANLLPYAGLVKELAARPSVDISYQHWRMLFDNKALLEALSGDLSLLNLLASAPAVFAEAIARPGFVEAVKGDKLRDAVAQARAAKKKGRAGWAAPLMAVVADESLTGEPLLFAEGILVEPLALRLAELWHLHPDTDPDKFEQAAISPEWLQHFLTVHEVVRADKELFEAARKSKALGAALYNDGDLLYLLIDRPALLPRLLDRSSGLLGLLYLVAGLSGALRTNDAFYRLLLDSRSVVQQMVVQPMWAKEFIANRELPRLFGNAEAWMTVQPSPTLRPMVTLSESLARVFADNAPVAEELLAADAEPLLAVLNELDASPGKAAVVDLAASGVVLVRWLKRNPQAVAGLVAVPRVVAGVVAHAGVFRGERLVERFMAAGELHGVLEAHPGVVGAVLGDVELLETALSSPGVVAAAAADPGVLRLLERHRAVRGLVRSGADAAGLVWGSAQVRRA
ncbi:hypothetical protein ACFY8B_36445, partial [Streptomyces sp. NPDC012751]|uniref:hypothetical protein n=1 Tax=Streptomyces sp. NPDC012751 TaxID=3364846 RepID=UPI0036AA9507